MNRKILIPGIIVLVLLIAFCIGMYLTGDLPFTTKCDPPKELDCRDVNLAGVVLKGNDLQRGDFAGANLSGADLSDAILAMADLSGVDLSGANLKGADMALINLSDANLSGAVLIDADLGGSDLTNANLTNADLTGVNFWFASSSDSYSLGAILKDTKMPDGTTKTGVMGERPTNTIPRSKSSQPVKTIRKAVSLSCRDGMDAVYCQVYWSDGQYSPLPMGVGPRQGGVVDAIIYYDLQWNPMCILLYGDGSILTSYDTRKCD